MCVVCILCVVCVCMNICYSCSAFFLQMSSINCLVMFRRVWIFDILSHTPVHCGACPVICIVVPVLLSVLWCLSCYLYCGACPVICIVVPVLLSVLWCLSCYLYCGACPVICIVVPVLLSVLGCLSCYLVQYHFILFLFSFMTSTFVPHRSVISDWT